MTFNFWYSAYLQLKLHERPWRNTVRSDNQIVGNHERYSSFLWLHHGLMHDCQLHPDRDNWLINNTHPDQGSAILQVSDDP